jgi:hypothetical protein
MAIDRAHVQTWLDRYLAAWKSYDTAEIGDLFSADADYRYVPWDEPEHGRETIVEDWITPAGDASRKDKEGTYDGEYEPWAVDGNRAVAIGKSFYFSDASRSTLVRLYWNSWLLEFDDDGRCASFVEYYMQQKDLPSA